MSKVTENQIDYEAEYKRFKDRIAQLDEVLGRLKDGLSGVKNTFVWQGLEAKHDPEATKESFNVAHNRIISVANIESMIGAVDMLRAEHSEQFGVVSE